MSSRRDLEFLIQDHLGVISLLQESRAKALLAPHKINKSQFTVLFLLAQNEDTLWTISDLSDHLEMNLSGLSKIVKQLSDEGFIKVKSGYQDGRQKSVHLTAKGAKKNQATLNAMTDTVSFTFSEWSTEELHELNSHLSRLKNWLDEHRGILLKQDA